MTANLQIRDGVASQNSVTAKKAPKHLKTPEIPVKL